MSGPAATMRLQVFTPTARLVDAPASRIVAEGPDGFFALLPRHVDAAAALVPGLFIYVTATGAERYLGVDEGMLVKLGEEVRVSVFEAFESADLDSLRDEVARRFLRLEDHERTARAAIARLEAGAIRRVLEVSR